MSYVRCLRWKWYILICTRRNSSRFLLHVWRTSAEKSVINAFLVGDLFVCLFVNLKPENPHFASRLGKEVNPLEVFPPGPHDYPWRSYQMYNTAQRHCTCQLYKVDGLARIFGLTQALYKSHPQPPTRKSVRDATCDPLDTNTQDSQGDDFCFVCTFCHHIASPPSTMKRRRGKPMNNLVS